MNAVTSQSLVTAYFVASSFGISTHWPVLRSIPLMSTKHCPTLIKGDRSKCGFKEHQTTPKILVGGLVPERAAEMISLTGQTKLLPFDL